MGHLDKKANESCSLKQGILDTLSQCVGVAADGSLGKYSGVLSDFDTVGSVLISEFQGLKIPEVGLGGKMSYFKEFSLFMHTQTHTHTPPSLKGLLFWMYFVLSSDISGFP